jgi:hypothetical protein
METQNAAKTIAHGTPEKISENSAVVTLAGNIYGNFYNAISAANPQ